MWAYHVNDWEIIHKFMNMEFNMNEQETVRLELLQHEDPEGLHPVELSWRKLARKLMLRNLYLESIIKDHHAHYNWRGNKTHTDCEQCKAAGFSPIRLPQVMK